MPVLPYFARVAAGSLSALWSSWRIAHSFREGHPYVQGIPTYHASPPYGDRHIIAVNAQSLFIERAAVPAAACRDPQGSFVLGVCTPWRVDLMGQPNDILGSNSWWSPTRRWRG